MLQRCTIETKVTQQFILDSLWQTRDKDCMSLFKRYRLFANWAVRFPNIFNNLVQLKPHHCCNHHFSHLPRFIGFTNHGTASISRSSGYAFYFLENCHWPSLLRLHLPAPDSVVSTRPFTIYFQLSVVSCNFLILSRDNCQKTACCLTTRHWQIYKYLPPCSSLSRNCLTMDSDALPYLRFSSERSVKVLFVEC